MLRLDAATFMLQWAVGGLAFLWFTTRRREVGLGYGWLLRGTYLLIAALGVVLGARYGVVWTREVAGAGVALAALAALGVSVRRKAAGVSGHHEEHDRRSARVAAMTGIERSTRSMDAATNVSPDTNSSASFAGGGSLAAGEFPPSLDLVAPAIGTIGLVAAAFAAAPPDAGIATMLLSLLRIFAGAAFLGAVTDAMLLGHWYLVQPGLPRRHLHELVRVLGWIWPVEVAAMLLPTGMISVLTGSVDDGWNGVMFWMWATCAVTTIGLVGVTVAALRERYYSAVMAATGLLYLAILTAFGTDLVARAVLDG